MQPFFKSIQINNLLSFGPDSPPIELGPLNVIIGTNGSGKSNLFDVLALLQDAHNDFIGPFREAGCPPIEWFWKPGESHRNDFKTEARINLHDEFFGNVNILLFLKDEDIVSHDAKFTKLLKHQTDSDVFKELGKIWQTIHIYKDWIYGRKSPLRFAQLGYSLDKWLNEDGSNLGVVLKKIKAHEESYARYLEFLKQLYEGVDDFEIDEYKDGTLRVYLREGERIIHAARLSDGTLRYLMLLAVLCYPEPPAVVCIEESEMGLHPDLVHVMAEALQYAAERTQVIVTTHSVSLVDCFTSTPEVIQVCEKHEGQTYIERLDPEKMSVWLDEYRLGDLWTSGEIGGNRW